jgi:cyclic pyranopterin phosphate synthase
VLSFEEIERLARVFVSLGVDRMKLTGGEPLLRADLPDLVRRLKGVPGLGELSLTTNGLWLAPMAADLRAAGLDRLTVSLDTLDPDRFRCLTGADALHRVRAGIDAARAAGFPDLRLNAVIMRGINDEDPPGLLAFARGAGLTLRFIEVMPLGMPREEWVRRFVPASGILAALRPWLVDPEAGLPAGPGPARYLPLRGGGRVGIIASVSERFCGDCDRLRLSARGALRLCLGSPLEADLRGPLRAGAGDEALRDLILRAVRRKPAIGEYESAGPVMCAVGG